MPTEVFHHPVITFSIPVALFEKFHPSNILLLLKLWHEETWFSGHIVFSPKLLLIENHAVEKVHHIRLA